MSLITPDFSTIGILRADLPLTKVFHDQTMFGDGTRKSPLRANYHRVGNGSPEGVVTAPVGTLYSRLDGGTNTTLYVKETGTGNTGWVAK
jgi:hypothetical protein